MSNAMPRLMLVLGVIFLLIGVMLSVKSDLIGTMQQGLNGATENAVIFIIIGLVCLFSGLGLRR